MTKLMGGGIDAAVRWMGQDPGLATRGLKGGYPTITPLQAERHCILNGEDHAR